MEKLLDFSGLKHPEDYKLYRFQCDCLFQEDAMDVVIEKQAVADGEGKFIIISMNFYDSDFWNRLKYAWQIVRGHWGWREFIIRKEDMKDLSNLVNPDITFEELP